MAGSSSDERRRPCPYDGANCLSKISFWWVTSLLFKGFKKHLDQSDLHDVTKDDQTGVLLQTLDRTWKMELDYYYEGKEASLFRALMRAFKVTLALPGILIFIYEATMLSQPFLIGKLMTYFAPDTTMEPWEAYAYGAGIGITGLLQIVLNPLYYFLMERAAIKMKVAVSGMVYRKAITLTTHSYTQTTSGQIINHLSTDIETFHAATSSLHHLWLGPVELVVASFLICYFVGGAHGLLFLLGLVPIVPLNIVSAKLFSTIRTKIGHWSDKRIGKMTEILSGMRIIKMFCWENIFTDIIRKLRSKEMRCVRFSLALKATNTAAVFICGNLMLMAVFLGCWMLHFPLSASSVFMTMGWLNAVKMAFTFWVPFGIENVSQMKASTQRVQKFLLLDEKKNYGYPGRRAKSVSRYAFDPQTAIEADHMLAKWDKPHVDKGSFRKRMRDSTSETTKLLTELEMEQYFMLKNINFTVNTGELIMVVGPVGSGKSSLMMALLGELPHQQGRLGVYGAVSYCAQEPWVFSGTVRQNVVFGDHLHAKRLEQVLQSCALMKDVDKMPHRDLTMVGERGTMLSGGQKARLTLARAVYKEADVYLLDDPLSAVDAKVGQHIFHQCILGQLQQKTRVVITHQLQYLKYASRILIMKEGGIADMGTFQELVAKGIDFSEVVHNPDEQEEDESLEYEEEHMRVMDSPIKDEAELEEKLIPEEMAVGKIGFKVYLRYLQAGYGVFLVPLLLIFGVVGQMSFCAADWMLALWTENFLSINSTSESKSSGEGRDWEHMPWELKHYIFFFLGFVIFFSAFSQLIFHLCGFASRRLHQRMFRGVMGTEMHFFDVHPAGRILNRFSKDMEYMENVLPRTIFSVVSLFLQTMGFFIVTCLVLPWLFLALLPIFAFVFFLRYFAVQTTRGLRRLEAAERSPLFSHVSDSIVGVYTIRAFKQQERWRDSFQQFLDNHTGAMFLYLSSFRWFSMRSTFSVVIFLNIVIFLCISLKESVSGTLLGLALIYCLFVTERFEYFLRLSCELENSMTSVERVLQYTGLKREAPWESERPPPPDWPQRGAISFNEASLRYTPQLPLALKHVECHIVSKEKVGIVGRTGAGKTSLMAAMFRLAEPEGTILIDGFDILKIGLHELRSKISVIPQDPVLFSGTLRSNLDPFDEYSDERLWHALEQVRLKEKVAGLEEALYTQVGAGAQAFSLGQRQLICLARALLRYNRILVLDEATANVDNETDDLIQGTIRARFRDCTVLTIAHRLRTVMDCDRIMVLDNGELVEFDTPYKLLQNPSGYFTQLVRQTGRQQAEQLWAMAELAFQQRKSQSILLERAVKSAKQQHMSSRENLHHRSTESLPREDDSAPSRGQASLNSSIARASKDKSGPLTPKKVKAKSEARTRGEKSHSRQKSVDVSHERDRGRSSARDRQPASEAARPSEEDRDPSPSPASPLLEEDRGQDSPDRGQGRFDRGQGRPQGARNGQERGAPGMRPLGPAGRPSQLPSPASTTATSSPRSPLAVQPGSPEAPLYDPVTKEKIIYC